MNRDPIRWIIALGFGLLLGLMSLLAYYAHIQIEASTDRLVEQIDIARAITQTITIGTINTQSERMNCT